MDDRAFRRFCEQFPFPLAVADCRGRLIWFNDALPKLIGVDREVILVRPFLDLVHPDDLERTTAVYKAMSDEPETPVSFRNRCVRNDGECVHVEWTVSVDRCRGWRFFTASDVTDQVLEQERHAEALRDLYRKTPAVMFQLGAEGEVTEVSDTFLLRSGYDRSDLLGVPAKMWVPESCQNRTSAAFRQLRREGVLRECPLEMRFRDGSVHEVLISAAADFDEDGLFVGARGVVEDVTERNEALRQLERERKELHQRNAELDEFAHLISHDLREPLRAIRLLSGWIEADLGNGDQARTAERFGRLRSRVFQLDRYIEGLTSYVRVGRSECSLEPVDLRELVHRVAEIVPVPERFQLDFEGAVPTLLADPTPLEQVLLNLMSNAVCHHLGAEGRIRVSAIEEDGWIRIGVRDDGPGIDPRFHRSIFEMGRRLAGARSRGSGLGLSLVRKLVESHGGTVRVESEVGHGALFEFTWPLFTPKETLRSVPAPRAGTRRWKARHSRGRPISVADRRSA